jgi:hypothetical protein
MDIGTAEYKGRVWGGRSASRFRHPELHENADEGCLGWLRSFSGLQVTAGLDHNFWNRRNISIRLARPLATAYGEMRNEDRWVLWAQEKSAKRAAFGGVCVCIRESRPRLCK